MQFEELENKGDFIKYCLEKDAEIIDIDTAIPAEVYSNCKTLGVCTTHLVSIYYKESTYVENIIAKATILYFMNKKEKQCIQNMI